jgi:hypothetical protein
MKRISETFIKKGKEIKDGAEVLMATRTLIQEEDFVLSLEEIERMEKNANARIAVANNEIALANQKLQECKKLRKFIE